MIITLVYQKLLVFNHDSMSILMALDMSEFRDIGYRLSCQQNYECPAISVFWQDSC